MLRSCLYRSMVHSPADIRLLPVSIQKIEDQSGPTDLMQRWEDGPGYIFLGIARRSGGTCLVPKGQGSRGCEIDSFLFPQRSGCEYANDQSHGR